MPQKPLVKNKKIDKKQAANRHGKTPRTKKGNWDLAPKKPKELAAFKENKEITKAINAGNESTFAAKAQNAGGKLKSVGGTASPCSPYGCIADFHVTLPIFRDGMRTMRCLQATFWVTQFNLD
ncbi:hypothetical protein DUNSADRAFT_17578 [Dunaliella salina]|uniref:Uncharacterized protein n=1 Tax=Dunaliella salina TaxID=3046 RepID=A0ABQ7G1J2_DUNSA|nr:hypothetical protein DUNSADRAFT_17578 [Dunaliella salina]|eukprot:KAF5828470.1 hypothetical protein DUNSADRAFT_17578 [Dunaliella salina]